jgi:DnaJ-domain-containing protein 1
VSQSHRSFEPLDPLAPGEFVRLVYRLGRAGATGVLTVETEARRQVLILRRGYLMTSEIDALGRQAAQRLARLAAANSVHAHFDGGTSAYPPGAIQRQFPVAIWARKHLEAQVDAPRAHQLIARLAGVRLSVRAELAPDPATCDASDVRILAAMRQPRRLDQIWPIARTPRFRLLSFIHFLDAAGALVCDGVAAPATVQTRTDSEAHRTLGVSGDADRESVKRAYRRLARALHPDLHPNASDERRRSLERKMADVTEAYRSLCG